jgi:hypothetical protein
MIDPFNLVESHIQHYLVRIMYQSCRGLALMIARLQ